MSSPPPRSGEIRRDPITSHWTIFSPARSRRPSDLKSPSSPPQNPNPNPNPKPKPCPFCFGNEHLCAPELFRHPPSPSPWRLRVIHNLFPALDRTLPRPSETHELSTTIPAFGFHDVVIEAPSHGTQLSDLTVSEIGDVIMAYKERILQIKESEPGIKYVQVFKNYGAEAGASLSHSHSQIVGMPVVPGAVEGRVKGMRELFERSGRCGLCEDVGVVVEETKGFRAVVPEAAAFPFEVWIVGKEHCGHFHEIDQEKAVDLGGLLKIILLKLARQLNDPPFNFMIHTSPLHLPASSLPYAHWYLQIVPKLSVLGGFEMATGCYINPAFPEDAAKILREVQLAE